MMRQKVLIAAIAFLLYLGAGVDAKAQALNFAANGIFKIVQFTDMHINLSQGKSEVCYELIREVLHNERPQLVVFTGDVVTERNPQAAWQRLVKMMQAEKCLWTVVFGNHDHEQGLSREEIYKIIKIAPNCLMERGNVKGVGNYRLNISASASEQTAAVLYFLDSHGNCEQAQVGGYQWIDFSQIDWLRKEDAGHRLPALAFFHIPLPEYNEVKMDEMMGEKGEKICSPKLNSGLFTVLKEGANVMATFVGHDHENDFIALHHGIALAYGRVSAGKNAYGKLAPGARVIQMIEGEKRFHTHILLYGGETKNHCQYPQIPTPTNP